MEKEITRVFVDFDGTITVRDVGDSIFEHFLRPELLEKKWHQALIQEWKAGRISSRDCLVRECENTVVTREKLNRLLDSHSLTPGFDTMVDFCGEHEIPLTVLSDGLDYYIEFILGKFGLGEVDYRANHMYFVENSIRVDFPYVDKGCGRCGNCKRWHIDSERREGDTVVYVGDGYSDRYAIRSADMVFARGDLAEYCDSNGIRYTPFEHFHDVIREMRNGNGAV
jgi:2,3-diketo-5-methylthio-1-phosphopentane phosphatase